MSTTTILIMGGYGNVGRQLARLLLQETKVTLKLAGRSMEKANSLAKLFNDEFVGIRVSGLYADASRPDSLRQAFKGVDLVLVASSTSGNTGEIASAALEAGCDYLDMHFGPKVYDRLNSMIDRIRSTNRCFITGAGFHPGLPAAMIRYGGHYFDRMDKAIVGGIMNIDYQNYDISESTGIEFVEELLDFQQLFFKEGEWRNANMMSTKDSVMIDFRAPFGRRQCVPLFFGELREIPDTFPGLRQTGFYMAGLNWFVDYFVFPIVFLSVKLLPVLLIKPMSKLMIWGLRTFTKPPYGLVLKLEAAGEKGGKPGMVEVFLSHEDGSYFTAVPVMACLLQYLDGSIRKPGLWIEANLVEPKRFIDDIRRMGIDVKINDSTVKN